MHGKTIVFTLVLATISAAQDPAPQRTLDGLIQYHQKRIAQSKTVEGQRKAIGTYVAALKEYLRDEAKGEEKNETRFALVGALLAANDPDEAKTVLKAFAPDKASALSCAGGAFLALQLQLKAEYEAWVKIAIAKKSSFADRMELGVQLMSHLLKPELGAKLFDAAIEAAKNDEDKAQVLWHRARATREREDVPEGSYETALGELAEQLPRTRFGRIAKDRLQAMEFKVGADPLPFAVQTLAGAKFELGGQKGKAVLVFFWLSDDDRCAEAAQVLQKLHSQHREKGLRVLGVSIDEKKKSSVETVRLWKTTFEQAWVQNGWGADLALRYRVEDVPYCLLIGRDGKIAGMNFVLTDEFGRRQLIDAVSKAVGEGK